MGFFEERVDGKVVRSGETFTCAHCNRVFEIVRGEAVAMCMREMKRICMPCEINPRGCRPFEEALKKAEARAAFRRQITG